MGAAAILTAVDVCAAREPTLRKLPRKRPATQEGLFGARLAQRALWRLPAQRRFADAIDRSLCRGGPDAVSRGDLGHHTVSRQGSLRRVRAALVHHFDPKTSLFGVRGDGDTFSEAPSVARTTEALTVLGVARPHRCASASWSVTTTNTWPITAATPSIWCAIWPHGAGGSSIGGGCRSTIRSAIWSKRRLRW